MSLLDLHEKIAKVAPILGVQENDDSYHIEYEDFATDEQKAEAEAIAANWVDGAEPDWNRFLDGLSVINGLLVQIAGSPLATIITTRISRLATGQQWKGAGDPLIESWNAAPPSLTQQQRDELTALADDTKIPISITEENVISAQ